MRSTVRLAATLGALVVAATGCPAKAPPAYQAPPVTPRSPVPPAAPAALVVMPADGRVTLDWTPVGNAVGYVAYLAAAPGVTPANYAGLPGGRKIVVVAPPLEVAGLVNGTPVHAVVTAASFDAEGAPSPEADATPAPDCGCTGWHVCDQHGACVAPAGRDQYLVGADFHALSDHWQSGGVPPSEDAFLNNYHRPGVRDAVRARLSTLALDGARVVKTQVWFVTDATTGPISFALDFPPSAQQLRNLRDYAADVAATSAPDGSPLELYLSDDWLGVADIGQGTPSTTLGSGHLVPAEYASRVEATLDRELAAVRGLFRADGRPAVTLVYLKSEVAVCATDDDADGACLWPGNSQPFHNMQWFMSRFYPGFVAKGRAAGLLPSVYFQVNGHERDMLLPGWRDPWYPALDGHITMTWVYRGLHWMRDHGLPLPERIDFTTGVENPIPYSSPATVLARVYDDARAVLPEFQQGPLRLGAAEAYYWSDPALTRPQARAFPAERLLSGSLEYVAFWPQLDLAPPAWDLSPFLLDGAVAPFSTAPDTGFETPGPGPLPPGWSAVPAGASPAARVEVLDAHGGTAVLRFDGSSCGAGCGSAVSPPVPVQAGQSAILRFWARSDIQQAGGHPPAADYSGLAVDVVGSSAGAEVGALRSLGTVDTGGAWRRFVAVVDVPVGVDALRLRFTLQNAGAGVADVDDLH
jgi:hypothetical protein